MAKIKKLSKKSQLEWDIPADLVSPHGFQSAVFELAGLERNPTPTRRLNALVRTGKAICAEFKQHILPKLAEKGKKDVVLAADDMLPIFIYVICQTELKHPLLNRDLLWGICHPDLLHGECGYYLTVYESALHYITEQEIDISGEATISAETRDFDKDSDYSVLVKEEASPSSFRRASTVLTAALKGNLIF